MTDCPNGDIRDLLPDLLSGTLPPTERAEVDAHLLACDDCRAELAVLRSMRSTMHRAPKVAVADIVSALPAYRAPVRHAGRGWGIAAAVALLLGGGTSVYVARNAHVLQRDSQQVAFVPMAQTTPGVPAEAHVAPSKVHVVPKSHPVVTAPAVEAPRELAVASANVGDLSDAELDALVNDLGSLDAVTPAEVEQPASVSPLPPSSTSGTGA